MSEPTPAEATIVPRGGPERGVAARLADSARVRVAAGLAVARRLAGHLRGVGVIAWLVLLAVTLTVFLARERTDISELGRELRTAAPGWLLAALVVQFAIIGLLGLQQWLVYRLLGQRLPYRLLLPLYLRRQVVATIVPGGAPIAAAMQVRRLADAGVPAPTGVFGEVISATVGTVALIALLVPVTAGLALAGEATAPIIVATLVLTLVMGAVVAGIGLALRPAGLPGGIDRRLPRRAREAVDEARSRRVTAAGLLPVLANAVLIDFAGVLLLALALRSLFPSVSLLDSLIGYVVGTAFLLVTPVFGGLGVVELGLAGVLAARGLPTPVALGGALVYRGFELWVPLMLGIAAEPVVRRGGVVVARTGATGLVRRLPAVAVAVTGLVTVLSVLSPHEGPQRFREVGDAWVLTLPNVARSATLVAGLLMLALAWGLWRRRRLAWLIAVGALLVATVAHAVKGHDAGFALVSALTLLVLGTRREEFTVRTAAPTLAGAAADVAGSLAVAVLYGTAGFWLLDRRDFGQDFSWGAALRETLSVYAGLGRGDLQPRTHYAAWFLDSITITGVTSIAVAAFAAWRPLAWRRATHPRDLARARDLLRRCGDSSLDTFKGWDDKLFWFSVAPDGRDEGGVAFRVDSGCALALGDPFALDDAAFERTLSGFVAWCDANGWRPAFHQATPKRAPWYRALGFGLLKIGEDAIVDLRHFSLEGRAMKSMRGSVRRLERDGYRTVIHHPPHAAELLGHLRDVSDAWLGLEGRRERGFTLGQWGDDYVGRCTVATLEGPDGQVVAFANLIGDGVDGEATIDLMRRRPDAPNSAMDALFVALFTACRDAGYDAFSLGMVPWVALGQEASAPPVERALARLNSQMERFFSVRGLFAYKDKFGPRWEPRYLAYPTDLDLPRVTVAIVRVTERSASGLGGWPGPGAALSEERRFPAPVSGE